MTANLCSGSGEVRSAVLVPVFRDASGTLRVVVIVRAAGGHHGGQLGFPGGRHEPDDENLLETAIRESFEEVGLCRHHIKHIEVLAAARTQSTGFFIQPYLAFIERPRKWVPAAAEVADILEPSIDSLSNPEMEQVALETDPRTGEERCIEFYAVRGYRLWGASYRILKPVLPRLAKGWPDDL